MKEVKKYLKIYGIVFVIILISTLVITAFNYYDIITGIPLKWIKIFVPILSTLLGGFLLGKQTKEKGYIEGIKFGGILALFLIIFNFLAFDDSVKWSSLIFYIIIILAGTLGSMIGINKKKM